MFILLYTRDGLTLRHPLRPGDTVVGRAPICDLPIDEPSISRRHVRFRVHGDHCVLTDLGGRNGTFVNGEQVTEAEVKAGDAVVLGRFPLRVDHGTVESLVFSDSHALVDDRTSIVRPAAEGSITVADFKPAAASERLLRLLAEISRLLVPVGTLANLLERIASVALNVLPVDRVFVLLMDQQGAEVLSRVSRARSNRPVTNANLSRAIVRRSIQDRVALLGCDAMLESGQVSDNLPENMRWFMCTPLCTEEAVLGLIYADNPNSMKLTGADLDVLQALGAYASAAIEQSRQTERMLEGWRLRERLQRHHSVGVAEQMIVQIGANPASVQAPGDRDVTVLMADIPGFMQRTKAMDPAGVAQFLNRCFSVMCEAVFAEDGTLDKFVSDRLIAVFGAPIEQPDHASRALRVAQVIRHALATHGTEQPVPLRIALNSGLALAGEIGWTKRREFTVIGEVVSTCERILSYVCEPGQIVMGRGTRDRLGPQAPVRTLGPVHLRGCEHPIDLFAFDPPQKE
jgi:adenylate cyclase